MSVRPGEIGLHDQAAAVLHQGMANEAEHGAGAGRLLVEPRLRVGGRGKRRVRPLLAPEVDLGIAVLAIRTGHRSGLGRGLFGVVFGWKLFMDAQAFTSVPSTEKWSSDKSCATSR